MKKLILASLCFVSLSLAGCTKTVNVDELISARELPQYTEKVEVKVVETTENLETAENIIVIDE